MARRLKLGQLLISKGLLAPEQLAAALAEQGRGGSRLGATLVRLGYVEEKLLVKVLSRQLQLPVARITGKRVKPEILERVPVELAEKYRCIPLFTRREDGAEVLFVGMDDPSDMASIDELALRIEQDVKPVLVAPSELEDALRRNYDAAAAAGPPARGGRTASEAPFPPEPDTAPDPLPDPEVTLPPIQPSPTPSRRPQPEETDTETEPQLPPMDPMLAGLDGPPNLDRLEEDPVLGGLAGDPLLGDPAGEPAPGRREPEDPAGVSFSAAGEEPVADLARAPFGDSDPELGGFVGGPFATREDEGGGAPAVSPYREDGPVARAPAPAPPAPASAAALEANVIIQALAQLLVEKGVIGRDEIAERIRRLAARKARPS